MLISVEFNWVFKWKQYKVHGRNCPAEACLPKANYASVHGYSQSTAASQSAPLVERLRLFLVTPHCIQTRIIQMFPEISTDLQCGGSGLWSAPYTTTQLSNKSLTKCKTARTRKTNFFKPSGIVAHRAAGVRTDCSFPQPHEAHLYQVGVSIYLRKDR